MISASLAGLGFAAEAAEASVTEVFMELCLEFAPMDYL